MKARSNHVYGGQILMQIAFPLVSVKSFIRIHRRDLLLWDLGVCMSILSVSSVRAKFTSRPAIEELRRENTPMDIDSTVEPFLSVFVKSTICSNFESNYMRGITCVCRIHYP
jgi:hypothetical protein